MKDNLFGQNVQKADTDVALSVTEEGELIINKDTDESEEN
jgi:hypothetical protein